MAETDNPVEYKPKNPASTNSVIETVKEYLAGPGFQHKIIGDTPTEANQLVPRKFVTASGTTANRPTAPVTGQYFYDTQVGKPVWWNGINWKDATGANA